MKKVNFNRAKAHNFLSKMLCSVMLVMAIVSFVSCSNKHPSELVGKWELIEVDRHYRNDGSYKEFPRRMELLKNGQGTFDGEFSTWEVEKTTNGEWDGILNSPPSLQRLQGSGRNIKIIF